VREILTRRDISDVHEYTVASETRREPIEQSASVTGCIVTAIADEDPGHGLGRAPSLPARRFGRFSSAPAARRKRLLTSGEPPPNDRGRIARLVLVAAAHTRSQSPMSRRPQLARSLFLVLVFAVVTAAAADTRRADTAGLQLASPETVGLSLERLKRLDEAMQGPIDRGEIAGVVTLAARHGKLIHSRAYGRQDLASGKPMPTDAIFRIYSMTKPVIGVAMMILYEEGKWHPEDPIAKFVPQFANLKVFTGLDAKGQPNLEAPAHPPRMQELMTHTAGFTYGVFGETWVDQQYVKQGVVSRETLVFETQNLQEMIDKLAKIPLLYQPGTRWQYSVSVDIQAYIVERLAGKTLPEFLRERIFTPLGMRDTDYFVPASKLSRLATLYQLDPKTNTLAVRAQPPDPKVMPSMTPGGLGLFSTAMDFLRFSQMLLNEGELDGVRILSPRTVELMSRNHLPESIRSYAYEGAFRIMRPGLGFGYDFGVFMEPAQAGDLTGRGTFYWMGAAQTWFWVDPELDVVFVGMTQRWFDARLVDASRATFYQALLDPAK
jgi:CubicO group peptidase (beta-lactamase class C family)